ncbi:unnamed protein product [Boreogadus saida]
MACSSEDTHGSNIANWQYRDPRTLSPLSSPAKNYSASNIEDSESQIPEVQVDDDEHLQSGGAAMETDEDLKALQPGYNWLQEYAIYLAGLNLSFLHIGEDSEMEPSSHIRRKRIAGDACVIVQVNDDTPACMERHITTTKPTTIPYGLYWIEYPSCYF